jgi:transcriptional regulator with GAF, ATPase, and Fis domain
MLLNYEYPGNVRELQNIIERAVLNGNELTPASQFLPGRTDSGWRAIDLEIPGWD